MEPPANLDGVVPCHARRPCPRGPFAALLLDLLKKFLAGPRTQLSLVATLNTLHTATRQPGQAKVRNASTGDGEAVPEELRPQPDK